MSQSRCSSIRSFLWAAFVWATWLAPFLIVSCGVLDAQPVLHQENVNVDFHTYRAELDRISEAASRLEVHPEEIQALRDSLPKKWTVTDHGTSHEVSTARLVEDLDQCSKEPHNGSHRASVQRRIAALETEAGMIGAGLSSSDEARRKLQEILARREFRSASKNTTWFERLLEKLLQWLSRAPRTHIGRVHFSSSLGSVVVWVMIVALCLALAYGLWRVITRTRENVELNLSGGEQFHKRSREWVADALAHARRGDYRGAIRCAYWGAVFRLEELGRFTVNRTLTPREYLRLLPADHFQRPSLADLTKRFELTWYGYAIATAGDFDQVAAQLEKLGCLAPSAAATEKS
jgi:hypothetical protein